MEKTYTCKVIDKQTAESFLRLTSLLIPEAKTKADIPDDERMTSIITVTFPDNSVKEYEKLAIIVEIMHAKIMEHEN